MNGPRLSVRGHTALHVPCPPRRRLGAFVIDFALAVALVAAAKLALDHPPVPRRLDVAIALGAQLMVMLLTQALFSTTPGLRAWGIVWVAGDAQPVRPLTEPRGLLYSSFVVPSAREAGARALSLLLTLLVPLGVATGLVWRHSSHPLWARAERATLAAYLPAQGAAGAEWTTAAFFYTLGGWPRLFREQPVLYSLPYAKGPPQQFVPGLVARWELPEIRLTIEGPKTPDAFQADPSGAVTSLRECLERPAWQSDARGTPCVRVRERALGRHLSEMRAVEPRSWRLRWFEVDNPLLTESERPRGVHLTAQGERRVQERYILINARGAHQTFVLDRTPAGPGELARMMLEQSVRSQRVFAELSGSRAWVDQAVAAIRLDELPRLERTPQFVPRVAEIQLRLLSKITVDPKTFDSYFHLAGVSLLLARHAAGRQNADWGAVAKPLVQSAWRYAQDVSPDDARLGQLERMWLDVRRL